MARCEWPLRLGILLVLCLWFAGCGGKSSPDADHDKRPESTAAREEDVEVAPGVTPPGKLPPPPQNATCTPQDGNKDGRGVDVFGAPTGVSEGLARYVGLWSAPSWTGTGQVFVDI